MTWVYDVRKKTFTHNGVYQFSARYAGAPGYKDNPDYECLINKGPLPRGKYRIVGTPFTHSRAGPYTLKLQPYRENDMCGRAGFLIHGDSIKDPGNASNGCIILAPDYRRKLFKSGDHEIVVI